MMLSPASPTSLPDQEAIDRYFPERVRNMFNTRAESWNRKYLPGGKLAWRLDAFCETLRECVQPPTDVLDFGCGAGHLAAHLGGHCYRVTGCDFAENMIAQARENFGASAIRWVELPARWSRLPFADHAFDAVVASSVFEYLADVRLVLGELTRVLKDEGALIFNVPNPESFRRWRECWSLRVTKQNWIRSAICTIPRVRRYFTHLDLSTNRVALNQWEWSTQMHGFQRVRWLRRRQDRHPLYMFAFRKTIRSRADAVSFPHREPHY
jgi:ubiquinone/menaquinone biosynthesis C-methylase UbiE